MYRLQEQELQIWEPVAMSGFPVTSSDHETSTHGP